MQMLRILVFSKIRDYPARAMNRKNISRNFAYYFQQL